MRHAEALEKKFRYKLFKQIGKYLSEKRLEKGLKQADIAEASGYSSQFISNIECGSAFPPPTLLTRMIETYGIEQSDFLDTLMRFQLEYYKEVYFIEKKPKAKSKTASSR